MSVKPRWAILIANALIPLAIAIFASGFFPHKPILPGFAEFDAAAPPAIFDKVVFMVVDALRRYICLVPFAFS